MIPHCCLCIYLINLHHFLIGWSRWWRPDRCVGRREGAREGWWSRRRRRKRWLAWLGDWSHWVTWSSQLVSILRIMSGFPFLQKICTSMEGVGQLEKALRHWIGIVDISLNLRFKMWQMHKSTGIVQLEMHAYVNIQHAWMCICTCVYIYVCILALSAEGLEAMTFKP